MTLVARLLLSAVAAVGVTIGLFYFMHYLIAGGEMVVSEYSEPMDIVFRQMIIEDPLQTRDRRIPEEPPPPEDPPPQPEMNVENINVMASPLPNLVPSLDVPFSGSGPFIGGLTALGSGLGQSGQLIPLVRIQPQYPRRAALAGIEGHVTLAFTITPTGSVTDVSVLESQPPRVFDSSAIRAILKWKFKPRVVEGQPVAMRATQTIDFSLDELR